MEKSQYELCVEVLRRLDNAGVLKDVVLVGSWCTLFYRDFFGTTQYRRIKGGRYNVWEKGQQLTHFKIDKP